MPGQSGHCGNDATTLIGEAMHTIRKGSSYKGERMIIRGFKTSEAMHSFLNAQPNNDWRVNSEPEYNGGFVPELSALKPGTYAYAGGKWHNVKSLDASALAHI